MAHALVTSHARLRAGRASRWRSANPAPIPAALAAASEWFPKRERALAIGIFNAGANVGAIVTPLIVPAIDTGARLADRPSSSPACSTSSGSRAWYRSTAGRASIRSISRRGAGLDRGRAGRCEQRPVPWRQAARHPPDLGLYGRPLPDRPDLVDLPVLAAGLLHQALRRRSEGLRPPLVAIYLLADVGSILGGWFSSRLLGARRLPPTARARPRCSSAR